MTKDHQTAIRFPVALWRMLEEDAKKSGWTVSEQVRYELLERRGMAPKPYLPQSPSYEGTTRKQRKKVEAA